MPDKPLCDHCGEHEAVETFTATMCAEDRQERIVNLCVACDLELNCIILEFCRVPGAAAKLQAYKDRVHL